MNLGEMKRNALALVEELNQESQYLTDDVDIQAKINGVVNHIAYEVARFKKIPKYGEMAVTEGQRVTFEDLEKLFGYEIYQRDRVMGVAFEEKAQGTVLKFLESGTAEIEVFVYPERITEKTKDSAYEFELSPDALEVMPYGIAADLLKNDVSAQYGKVYAERYKEMLQLLDSRYRMASYTMEGGVEI